MVREVLIDWLEGYGFELDPKDYKLMGSRLTRTDASAWVSARKVFLHVGCARVNVHITDPDLFAKIEELIK